MTRTIFVATALALVVTLLAVPAQALAGRTFVSGAGNDGNPCSFASPCRSLQAAYNATEAEGEINVLDPAGYGALTISQGISIEGHGWASMQAVSGGAAITINGGDKINIRGVVLNGVGVANTTGIQFNSGGTLTVRDSVVRNFALLGISFTPSTSTPSQFFVSNTLVSDNGDNGIFINPLSGSGNILGVLNHVEMVNNATNGLVVATSSGAPVGTQSISVTVTDSVSANNINDGIIANPSRNMQMSIMVRNSTIANNGGDGLLTSGLSTLIFVTRSTITGNTGAGWSTSGGTVSSYGDNNIDGNGTANTEPPGSLVYH